MGPHLEPLDQYVIVHCSVCGHLTEPFDLPGRPEKFCLPCSADLATALLLTSEIDAATLSGQNPHPLIHEFTQLSRNMLSRSQSADPLR